MKKICAWCKKELENVQIDVNEEHPVTHGICPRCAQRLLFGRAKPLHEFLDSLGVSILLIESEPKVLTANKHARNLLGKELPEIEGHKGGDVIQCVYASTPSGCGNDVHCKSCTIRRTVLETFATGRSFVKVRTYPDIQLVEEVKTMSLTITTEKAGDVVLLRIDELWEQDAQPTDAPDKK